MTEPILLSNLVSRLPLGICVVDKNFEVLYWNDFFKDRLDHQQGEQADPNILDIFPQQASLLKKKINNVFVLNNSSFSYWEHRPHPFAFSSSRPITGEETLMYQNIEFFPLEIKNNKVNSVGLIVQDVTELASYYQTQKRLSVELEEEHAALSRLNKKLEDAQNQLLQSEKMAAIGQLAAGIAHEINNPIGFVNSNIQCLKEHTERLTQLVSFFTKLVNKTAEPRYQDLTAEMLKRQQYDFIAEDLPELIEDSVQGIDRVSEIVKNLKTFSHADSSEWQWADIREGIDNTIKIASNQLKYKANLSCDYATDLPLVHCQPMQLNQVFLNLLVNASQAIDERGEIFVHVRHEVKLKSVTVKITDTGSGIESHHIQRIFEPFFTTKPVGKGTGLGLSLSYSIIKKHHGEISVTSEAGKGTCFTITLPIDCSEPEVDDEVA